MRGTPYPTIPNRLPMSFSLFHSDKNGIRCFDVGLVLGAEVFQLPILELLQASSLHRLPRCKEHQYSQFVEIKKNAD